MTEALRRCSGRDNFPDRETSELDLDGIVSISQAKTELDGERTFKAIDTASEKTQRRAAAWWCRELGLTEHDRMVERMGDGLGTFREEGRGCGGCQTEEPGLTLGTLEGFSR